VDELRTSPYYKAFIAELARLGFVEGQNLLVDRYSGEGQMDAYADLARTVVSNRPEAILTAAPPMTFALKAATQTIPIVTIIGDPVALGLAVNLARPGANVTGLTVDGGMELHGKRLSLLVETKPHASRLAYLCSSAAWKQPQAAMVREAAQLSKLALTHIDLGRTLNETTYTAAFALVKNAEADVLLVSDEPEHLSNSRALVDLATRARLPAMYPFRDLALAGGLMAYYRDLLDALRQAADQVAKILVGENPAEMPFRQPTSFRLSINTKAARQIGVAVPPMLLASADEVIE
jgi:putative ABC transport system substrate-binding protein